MVLENNLLEYILFNYYSVSVEHVTDIKRTHTAGEGQFFSCALSFPPSLPLPSFALSKGVKENHVIPFILSKANSM